MYLIGKRRCPACGIKGKLWKRKPEVFICPTCSSVFNEFGVVLESQMEKQDNVFT